MTPGPQTPTAILISGTGSNMKALVEAADDPLYPARIVSVISNRPEAPGLAWAKARGLPTAIVDHKAYPSREAFEAALQSQLNKSGAELVALAGFMRVLTPAFVEVWQGRMINIHPSLLPAFPGLHTHEQALAAGVVKSGCTVHFVTPELDAGPIIAQGIVPVLRFDTPDRLAARVLAAEHIIYPAALSAVAAGHIRLEAGCIVRSARGAKHA